MNYHYLKYGSLENSGGFRVGQIKGHMKNPRWRSCCNGLEWNKKSNEARCNTFYHIIGLNSRSRAFIINGEEKTVQPGIILSIFMMFSILF